MRAVRLAATTLAAALLAAGPLGAVGLGPLNKEGLTDGPDKAFYLTLINPYTERTGFTVYAVGVGNEDPQARVTFPISNIPVAAGSQRRFLVIAHGLAPGETYQFRVCATRTQDLQGAIYARVCSRLTARRVSARG